jgi:hypothetical protein
MNLLLEEPGPLGYISLRGATLMRPEPWPQHDDDKAVILSVLAHCPQTIHLELYEVLRRYIRRVGNALLRPPPRLWRHGVAIKRSVNAASAANRSYEFKSAEWLCCS